MREFLTSVKKWMTFLLSRIATILLSVMTFLVSGIYTLCLKQPCRMYGGAGTLFPDLDRIYRRCLCIQYKGAYVACTPSGKLKARRPPDPYDLH